MRPHTNVLLIGALTMLLLAGPVLHGQVTTILTVPDGPYAAGVPIRLVAQTEFGTGIVAGWEDFYDGLHSLGSVQVTPVAGTSSGKATLSVLLPPGPHSLSVRFNGSSTAGTSNSGVLTIDVEGLIKPSISLSSSSSGTYSVELVGTGTRPESGALLLSDATNASLGSITLDATRASLGVVGLVQSLAQHPGVTISADIDGDGRPDLIVASAIDGTVTTYLGTSIPGSFKQGVTIDVGTIVSALVAADFNCDGALDLAILQGYDGTMQVLLGDTTHPGTLLKSGSSMVLHPAPSSVISADFDRDGLPDLAVASGLGNSVSVLLNNPNDPGHFLEAETIEVGSMPVSLAAGDLRQLGVLDIAVANFMDGTIAILKNDLEHPGTFLPTPSFWKAGEGTKTVLVSDLDGDGLADLVTCNELDQTISVFPGQRSALGTFPTQRLTSVSGCSSVLATDYNKDGLVDIVALDQDSNYATLLLNSGYGLLQNSKTIALGPQPQAMIAANFTGSIWDELLVVDGSAQTLQLFQEGWILDTAIKPSAAPQGEFSTTFSPTTGSEYAASFATIAVAKNDKDPTDSAPLKRQTISLQVPRVLTYGDSPVALTATATSGLPVFLEVVSGPASLNNGVMSINGAGTLLLRASQSGSDAYARSTYEQTIPIFPRPLIVTPNPSERNFGADNPAFNGKVDGLLPGDEIQVAYTSAANASTPAGIYDSLPFAIVPTLIDKGGRLQNYAVTENLGNFSILPPKVPITPPITLPPQLPGNPVSSTPILPVVPVLPIQSTEPKPAPPSDPVTPISTPVPTPLPVTPVPPIQRTDPKPAPPSFPFAPISTPTPNPFPVTPVPPVQGTDPKLAPPSVSVVPVSTPVLSPAPVMPHPVAPILTPSQPIGRQPVKVSNPTPSPYQPGKFSGVRVSVHFPTENVPSILTLSAEVIGLARESLRSLNALSSHGASMLKRGQKLPTATAAAAQQLSTPDGPILAIAASVMTPDGPVNRGYVGLEQDGHKIESRALDAHGTAVFLVPTTVLNTSALKVHFTGTQTLEHSISNAVTVFPHSSSMETMEVGTEQQEWGHDGEDEEYSCP